MKPEFAHLFTRPFWLDEWHTALVANRASLSQVFSDLYQASDMGPPLLHIIAWVVAKMTSGLTPLGGRLISFTSVLLALILVFLVLRRRFGVVACVAGTLAVTSHQLVVAHAFELRYYCLWLACAAGFAWALSLDHSLLRSRRRDVAVAIWAILLCMTHWLAVLSLGLMCVGVLVSYGRDWRAGLRRVLPAAAGFVVLALSVPLVLAQRAAVAEQSWMPDVTLGEVRATFDLYWGDAIVLVSVLVILSSLVSRPIKDEARATIASVVRDPSVAALVSLLFVPVLMSILSVVYPALNPRYSIATFLGWAPLVAIAVELLGKPVRGVGSLVLLRTARGVVFVLLLFFVWVGVLTMALDATRFRSHVVAGRDALATACGMNLPVVFQVRHLMYPSTQGASGPWARCDTRLLAIPNDLADRMFPSGSNLPRFLRFENEIARLHQRLYAYPKVSSQPQLDSLPRFLLIGWAESFPVGYKHVELFGGAVFPNHRVTRITEDLTLFEHR
jgi:hypothetical protein